MRASDGRSSGRTRIGGRFDSDGAEEVDPNEEFLSSIGESGTDWTLCGCLPAPTAAATAVAPAGSFGWLAPWSSVGVELVTHREVVLKAEKTIKKRKKIYMFFLLKYMCVV